MTDIELLKVISCLAIGILGGHIWVVMDQPEFYWHRWLDVALLIWLFMVVNTHVT